MHSVCRAHQGVEWTREEPKGLDANLRHLVNVSARPNPESFAPDTLRLAYGAWSAPKLVSEIAGDSLILRQKALREALKQMAAPKELAALLAAGLVPALNGAADDADDAVRASVTASLAQVARQRGGSEELLAHGSISVISRLVVDVLPAARGHALVAILELAKSSVGAKALVDAGAVALLFSRCKEEVAPLQATALMALQQCMSVQPGLVQAIADGALEVIVARLSTAEEPLAREKAALCLAAYTVNLHEKKAAEQAGALPPLFELLRDASTAVNTAGAAALMSLTIDNEVKAAAVKAGAVPHLTSLLDGAAIATMHGGESESRTAALTVNTLKCISNLAEHPSGRKLLMPVLDQVEGLCSSDDVHVAKAAKIAAAIVAWKP